jgi:hypothetical protein
MHYNNTVAICIHVVQTHSISIREGQSRAKVLNNMVKQKRKEKAVSILDCVVFVLPPCML